MYYKHFSEIQLERCSASRICETVWPTMCVQYDQWLFWNKNSNDNVYKVGTKLIREIYFSFGVINR